MKHKYLKNVVTLKYDGEKCTGCGMCVKVCPHNVFTMKEGKAFLSDRDSCMECGACAMNCPFSAIQVRAGVGCAYAMIRGKVSGSGSGDCNCG